MYLKFLILCTFFLNANCSSRLQCSESDKLLKILRKVEKIERDTAILHTIFTENEAANFINLNAELPRNCKEVQKRGKTTSGIYHIQPKRSPEPFPVYCDMETRNGGWTYLLNRFDGSQDFYLDWKWYKHGFGNLEKEFWLGLEKIHLLTGFEHNELLIELEDWAGGKKYALYSSFGVGNEDEGYILKMLSGYSGTAGDSFRNEAGMRFTTKDKDLDVSENENCAVFSNGGWWYRDCKWTHLTGKYFENSDTGNSYLQGIYWVGWHGNRYSLKSVKMMVRPRGKEPIVHKVL